MTKILCLVTLCFTAVAGLPQKGRIINGSITTIDQYPFMAGILLSPNGMHFGLSCGGAIINNRSVLTAVHCFNNLPASHIRIRVGSALANSGGYVHISALIIPHPDYILIEDHQDIGIVRVTTAFSFGPNVQVGRIAGPNYNPGDNQPVWGVGWGQTTTDELIPLPSQELRHVQIYTVNQNVCAEAYGSILKPYMICAGGGGKGICIGDSGGPLVHNNVIVGVTALTRVPCAAEAAIFVRTSSYTDWIQKHA